MLGSVLPDFRAAYGLDYQLGGTLLSAQSDRLSRHRPAVRSWLAIKWGLKRAYLILYYVFAVGFVMLLDQRLAGLAAGGHVPDRHFQGRLSRITTTA